MIVGTEAPGLRTFTIVVLTTATVAMLALSMLTNATFGYRFGTTAVTAGVFAAANVIADVWKGLGLIVVAGLIDASNTGDLTFLVNENRQAFTANGFGNKMRDWCDEAGLPFCTSHGLRKTGAAIAAENGATAHQLMSIFGWLTLKEAERYTRAAEQKKIAARAMTMLERGAKKEQE